MKQKLRLYIVRALIPTEPKARKKFIKALFPGKHLHGDPVSKARGNIEATNEN